MSHAPPEELPVEAPREVPTESLLVARAGGRLLALPLAEVREVVPELPLTVVPGAGAAVCGMVNVRGRVLPVIELATALGLGVGRGHDRRLLVVEQRERLVALRVDEVVRIERVPVEELQQATRSEGAGEWFRSTVVLDAGEAGLLATDELLESIVG
jgi:chemotaxis signal transduction protein